MTTAYRIYMVDSDGHVTVPWIIECADDQDAMRQAEYRLDSKAIEVWHGSERVGRLKPRE